MEFVTLYVTEHEHEVPNNGYFLREEKIDGHPYLQRKLLDPQFLGFYRYIEFTA